MVSFVYSSLLYCFNSLFHILTGEFEVGSDDCSCYSSADSIYDGSADSIYDGSADSIYDGSAEPIFERSDDCIFDCSDDCVNEGFKQLYDYKIYVCSTIITYLSYLLYLVTLLITYLFLYKIIMYI